MNKTDERGLRGKAIIALQGAGFNNRQVAQVLCISASTVSDYSRRYHFNKYYNPRVKTYSV